MIRMQCEDESQVARREFVCLPFVDLQNVPRDQYESACNCSALKELARIERLYAIANQNCAACRAWAAP